MLSSKFLIQTKICGYKDHQNPFFYQLHCPLLYSFSFTKVVLFQRRSCGFVVKASYLKVHGVNLVSYCVGLAHCLQHWGDLVRVVQALHQRIDGVHDSVSVFPELGAFLQLLCVLDMLELAEVLLGWGEVHKQPVQGKRYGSKYQMNWGLNRFILAQLDPANSRTFLKLEKD